MIKSIELNVDYGTGNLVLNGTKRPDAPGLEQYLWDTLVEALDPHKLIELQRKGFKTKGVEAVKA